MAWLASHIGPALQRAVTAHTIPKILVGGITVADSRAARQAVFALFTVLMVALLVLIPNQSRGALGLELGLGVAGTLAVAVRQ